MGERSGRKEAMSSSSCNLKSFMIIIQKMQIIFIERSKGWGLGWWVGVEQRCKEGEWQ